MKLPQNKDLHNGTPITFADGVVRTIRPLTIRQLRKFMKVANDLKVTDDASMTDEDIDKMIEAASIALSKVDPDLAQDEDALEDALDLKCFGQLMAAAMGNDPNL